MNLTAKERALSALLKAERLESTLASTSGELSSLRITQAQEAAEHAFRAILFASGISRIGHHRLDTIAENNKARLAGIWPRLQPILPEYAWLWDQRNVAKYDHGDVPREDPPLAEPPITENMIERATGTVFRLLNLARTVVA